MELSPLAGDGPNPSRRLEPGLAARELLGGTAGVVNPGTLEGGLPGCVSQHRRHLPELVTVCRPPAAVPLDG